MGQTIYELEHSVQHEEHGTQNGDSERAAYVGGYSEKRDFPRDNAAFIFDSAPNVLEAESFATESASVLTTRLFMVFGAFDLVSMSTEEWSVERPGEILGRVKVYYRAGNGNHANADRTVQSKITVFDSGASI